MTIRSRPYADSDLPRLQAALADWIRQVGDCGYYHVGNIAHRIYEGYSGSRSISELVQVWEDGQEIVGFSYNFVFESGFFVFTSPPYRGSIVELAMLRSAYEVTRRFIKESQRADLSVITDVFNCDQTRISLLTQLGFKHYRLWDYITERTLSDAIPPPMLPDGFTIRSATMDDYAQLAHIRNNTFGGTWTPEAYRDGVMRKPAYQPEREIVIAAPDGRLAAFTVIRLDEVNQVGLFEPVGVHGDFRRMGLAHALMLHAMAQMKKLGMKRATVEHLAENIPASALYSGLGFKKKYETLGFRSPATSSPTT